MWEEDAALCSRNGAQWEEALTIVPEEERSAVARLAWWDFASNETRDTYEARGFQVFDSHLNWENDLPEDGKIIKGLMAIGYSPDRAATRIWRSHK